MEADQAMDVEILETYKRLEDIAAILGIRWCSVKGPTWREA